MYKYYGFYDIGKRVNISFYRDNKTKLTGIIEIKLLKDIPVGTEFVYQNSVYTKGRYCAWIIDDTTPVGVIISEHKPVKKICARHTRVTDNWGIQRDVIEFYEYME